MSALPVSSESLHVPPDALSRYREAAEEIVDRIAEYAMQVADAQELINNISVAAEIAQKKLAALEILIALEEQGPELPAAHQMSLPVNRDAIKRPTPIVSRDEFASLSGRQQNLAKTLSLQWQTFVEDRLYERGRTTVDALYLEAPPDWRNRFEGIPSKLSGLFRARRLLRRSATFEVDRDTGMVTMLAGASPKVPPYVAGDAIVLELITSSDNDKKSLAVRFSDGVREITYSLFKEMLAQGQRAWLRNADDTLVPLAIKRLMGRKSRLSSYDEEGWTPAWSDFAKIAPL